MVRSTRKRWVSCVPDTRAGFQLSRWLNPGRMSARTSTLCTSKSALALLAGSFLIALGVQPSVAQVGTRPAEAPSFEKPAAGTFSAPANIDRSQPLYLQGDELIYQSSGDSVIARGNVEIYYNNYVLTADEVTYDQSANTLTAAGNVVLKEPGGTVVRADRYTLTDDFRDGFVQSLSVVTSDETRIAARKAIRRDGNVTAFRDGKFTPCKSKGGMPPLWCISSQRVIHDKNAGLITYQDAAFELFGAPVLYLPYFQHPDTTKKRQSGFLFPQYGSSEDLGFAVEVPYYFALAPNYDFTFRPMYTSQQGVLWQGDWRHRLANGYYNLTFAAIDQDAAKLDSVVDPARKEELDGLRGSIETDGQFSLSSWWRFGWDITLETDDTFRRFYKLDSVFLTDRINNIYLRGQSDRNYFGAELYHFGGLLLNDTPQSESRVHPVIDYNVVATEPVLGGEVRWDTNILSFSRDDFLFDDTSRQDLNRVVSELKWRKRFIDQLGITYTPFAHLRGDIYQLNNFVDPITGEAISNDATARGLATGGVTVAYPWVAATAGSTHTIEPIGQIIGRQESVEQDRLPNEDAKSLVFDDTNLFEVDKYSGYDRVETGTRANVGVQYSFQLNDGGHARVLAGQSFQLSGENAFSTPGLDVDGNFVNNPSSGLETDRSDYVLGAYLAPTENLQVISQSRFDHDDFDLRRQDTAANLSIGPLTAYGTYAFVASDAEDGTEETEQEIYGGASLQLTDNWRLSGQIRYDFDESRRVSDEIRLRYADECFVLTASYVETFIEDESRDITPDRAVYLRFELKHLGEYEHRTFVFGEDQPPGAE